MTIQDLLHTIEDFCIEYKIGKSQFGTLVCGNHNIINDLRAGRAPTLTTVEKVVEFMRRYRKNKDREMKRFFLPTGETGLYQQTKDGRWVPKNYNKPIGA